MLSRFNQTPPFVGCVDDVKFRFESRVEAFEVLFKSRSELSEYSDQCEKICERLRQTYDLRNYLAHGIARYDVATEVFTVRRILPTKEDPWNEVALDIPAAATIPETSKMSLFCQEFMHFARDISERFELEF